MVCLDPAPEAGGGGDTDTGSALGHHVVHNGPEVILVQGDALLGLGGGVQALHDLGIELLGHVTAGGLGGQAVSLP